MSSVILSGLPGEHPEEMEDTLRQIKELAPDSLTVHALAMKHGSRLTRERAASTEKQNYKQMARELEEMIDMARKAAGEMGLYPYYLYRQKNIAGNFENVGYAKVDKAGIYNILIWRKSSPSLLPVQAHRLRWCFRMRFRRPEVKTGG